MPDLDDCHQIWILQANEDPSRDYTSSFVQFLQILMSNTFTFYKNMTGITQDLNNIYV